MITDNETKQAFPFLDDNNDRLALTIGEEQVTYAALNQRINDVAAKLLKGGGDLREERIAMIIPPSLDYVTLLFAIWRAGGIAIPLNINAVIGELEHYLVSTGATQLIVSDQLNGDIASLCAQHGVDHQLFTDVESMPILNANLPSLDVSRRAMILFTSGTTNKPKGVVSTHSNIHSQILSLLEAWEWQKADCIPLFLPMHHVHGIINILCCGLWAGATIDVFTQFDIETLLPKVTEDTYTLFMAVPTIYAKLISYLEGMSAGEKEKVCNGFRHMRLNVSGSAACPIPIYEKWLALTEQVLLERYGMTEIGMAISNPYRGERRAGAVGVPLPGVEVALFDEKQQRVSTEGVPGEIRIKGKTVFLEYWGNKSATEESFVDGWFCTGDVAVVENGYYRIMGRSSIDIIKSGGFKISALEIEGVLLSHDEILECAVIGVPDPIWGEAVTAVVVLAPGSSIDDVALKEWCTGKMSSYKIPKSLRVVDSLPRNAMGKVTKTLLQK
ncbi:acyl-CoA synthetase [Aurantivibrio plasticivorans]